MSFGLNSLLDTYLVFFFIVVRFLFVLFVCFGGGVVFPFDKVAFYFTGRFRICSNVVSTCSVVV